MAKEPKKKFAFKDLGYHHIQAWESLLTRVLSYRSRTYEVKKTDNIKTFHNECAAFKLFDYKYGYLAKEDSLVGRFTPSHDDIQKVANHLKEIYEAVEDPHMCELSVAEVLTKVLAYRNLEQGMEIQIPTKIDKKIRLRTFRVDKVFDLWNQMKAFGLCDIDGKEAPLLLFRGTDFSLDTEESRSSVVCNLDPNGPGRSIYTKARNTLRSWLGKVTDKEKKARAYGYSLGGALATYAIVLDHEFFSKKASSYLFHHPGVESDLEQKWNELSTEARPIFEGVVGKGDPVSKYGKLVGKVSQVSVQKRLPPIQSHTLLFFTQPEFQMAELDIEAENGAKSRHIYTKLHGKSAKIFYEVALKSFFPFMVPDVKEDDETIWT